MEFFPTITQSECEPTTKIEQSERFSTEPRLIRKFYKLISGKYTMICPVCLGNNVAEHFDEKHSKYNYTCEDCHYEWE